MARARPVAPQKDKSERWLLTYADMITLLLALFVVLFAMSKVDEEKFQVMASSLAEGFNVPVPQNVSTAGIVPLGSVASGSAGGLALVGLGHGLGQELQAFAEREGLGDEISVRAGEDAVVVTLGNSVAFASGSANLRPAGQAALGVIAASLRGAQLRHTVRIEGHTDNVQPRTVAYPTNWELSAARAAGVARHFAAVGVEPDRLSAIGLSDNRPTEDNATAEGRARNRRVEIWIVAPPAPGAKADAGAKAAAPRVATPRADAARPT